jgi:predicted N-acyltransferase
MVDSCNQPTQMRPSPAWGSPLPAKNGLVYAVDLPTLQESPAWPVLLQGARRDHRFHALVEQTIQQGFEHHYLVMEDQAGQVRAIQPFFVHAQDLLGGVGGRVQTMLARLRRTWPRFLTLRTLMVGTPIGDGGLGAPAADAGWCAEVLAEVLVACARRFKVSLVVMKEFDAGLRPVLTPLQQHGFLRLPSLPYVAMDLDFANFDEHMQKSLSKNARKDLRRKFRDAAALPPLEMQVLSDITPQIDELYPLYLAVYERAKLRFEKLTPQFFCRLGQDLPQTTRFFVWRQQGKAVAFSVCTLHDGGLHDEYIGLDYSVALDLHLYFLTLRDVMNWCCQNGIRRYYSTALNYEPKLHLRFKLAPVDLYLQHRNRWLNKIFRLVVPLLDPTRGQPVLQQFPNADQLR